MSELGPDARAVVDAGRAGDEPTTRDKARVRAALMAAVAAGGAAAVAGEGAAAAATATKGGAVAASVAQATAVGGLLKSVIIGAAVAGVFLTGVAVTSQHEVAAPPPAAVPPAGVAASPLPPARPAREASSPVAKPAAPAPVRAVAAPASPAHAAEPAPAEPASRPVDRLEAETRDLGAAHGALKDGDPARALTLLDEQSAEYADGQLREERAAARVLALCKLGRTDEARALAARFLAENPRSMLVDRVRGACPVGDSR